MGTVITEEPEVALSGTLQHRLESQLQRTAVGVVGPGIVGVGIAEHLSDGAASARHIPHRARHLVDQYRRTGGSRRSLLLQRHIVGLHLREEPLGLFLLSIEHPVEAHPLSTGQG